MALSPGTLTPRHQWAIVLGFNSFKWSKSVLLNNCFLISSEKYWQTFKYMILRAPNDTTRTRKVPGSVLQTLNRIGDYK